MILHSKPAFGFERELGSSLENQPSPRAWPKKMKTTKYLSVALCLVSLCLIDSIASVHAAEDVAVDFLEGIGFKE